MITIAICHRPLFSGTQSAYGAPQVYGSPSPGAASQSEIDELRERIRVLEGAGKR